jgi:hypothetical protein
MKTTMKNVAAGMALLLVGTSLPAQQSASPEAEAEAVEYSPVYRVEVIVFRHVDGRSDRIRSAAPVDFTDQLDPLVVARANDIAERQLAVLAEGLPVARIPEEIDESTPRLETDEQTLRPIPPVYSTLGDLSRPIQRAMDRLLDAAEYDPVMARAWIQLVGRGRAVAAMRIHDQTVVDVIEPDANRSLVPVPHALPFGPSMETPPPALNIYRLDGTVRLRQRQFLHLDLDLVWQTRAPRLADRMPPADMPAAAIDGTQAGEGEWQLHRLQQSRIVKPGRLEYFDSSLFGVLVRIERFAQIVPEIKAREPDPAAPAANPPESSESSEIVDPVTNSGL